MWAATTQNQFGMRELGRRQFFCPSLLRLIDQHCNLFMDFHEGWLCFFSKNDKNVIETRIQHLALKSNGFFESALGSIPIGFTPDFFGGSNANKPGTGQGREAG